MPRINLDPRLVERLLDGRLAADDLPSEVAPVAAVLAAARRGATKSDMTGLQATVAAMVAAAGGSSASQAPAQTHAGPSRLPKLLAGSAAGLSVLFGGLAAAGALPSLAQNPVADIASHVGIDLPHDHGVRARPNAAPEVASTTSTTEASENDQQATTTVSTAPTVGVAACPTPAPDNHGAFVSGVAQASTTTSTVGVPPSTSENHGAAVSAAAKSDCGKPAQAGGDHPPQTTTSTTQALSEPNSSDNGHSGGSNDGSSGGGPGQSQDGHGSAADAHRPPTP